MSGNGTSAWLLKRCSTSPQRPVKVIKKGDDSWGLLFDSPHDMASVFVVGVEWAEVVVSKTSKGQLMTTIKQFSESFWKSLWQSYGNSPNACSTVDISIFHDNEEEEEERDDSGGSDRRGDDGLGGGGGDSGGGGRDGGGGGGDGDGGDSGGNGGSSLLSPDNALHITLILGSHRAGDGLSPLLMGSRAMVLPGTPENKCLLHGSLTFTFSEVVQPQAALQHLNQKILDLSISSSYELANSTVVAPSSRGIHVGIVHDELQTRFHCTTSRDASTVVSSEAVELSSINVQEKTLTGHIAGSSTSLQIGVNKYARALGTWEWSTSKSTTKEHDQGMDLPTVKGTPFVVIDSSDHSGTSTPAESDVLAFIALHSHPLRNIVSMEETGLKPAPRAPCLAALGRSAKVTCLGKLLLNGARQEGYSIELQRILGEFIVQKETFEKKERAEGVVADELAMCLQHYKVNIIINHGFDLSPFRGAKLFWKLQRVVLNASPLPDLLNVHIDEAPSS